MKRVQDIKEIGKVNEFKILNKEYLNNKKNKRKVQQVKIINK